MVETTKIIIIKFILSKMMFIVYYQRQRGYFSITFHYNIRIPTGTPVICHGLKGNKSRANGKIGVVGSINPNSNVCTFILKTLKLAGG